MDLEFNYDTPFEDDFVKAMKPGWSRGEYVNNALSPYAPWKSQALPLSPALFNWRSGGTYGKKVIFLGDSTTSAPSPPWADITGKMGQFNTAGGQIDNVSMVNAGEIGVKFSNVMNGTSVFNVNWLTAQTFDLLVVCLGINDVRDGSTNAAQISTMLTNLVAAAHAAQPNACIVLWTPNSFLSNDPTSSGYITPNISFAQQYTDALWNGYNNVVGTWPTYVAHLDKQQIYGRTCLPGPTALMQDTLHPDTVTGYQASALALANLIIPRGWPFTGPATQKDLFLTENVLLLNGNNVLDARGRHTMVANVGLVTASGGWLNFDGSSGLTTSDNPTDFQFGTWSGGAGTAKCTVEIQINSPVRVQANGQVLYCNNNNLQMGNGSDPNCYMNIGNYGNTNLTNDTIVTGGVVNYAFEYGQNKYSTYKNGVRTSTGFSNADFNAGAGTLFLGQEQTGWPAVLFKGQARYRVTRECRYNHAPAYTVYPDMWPTT